MVVTKLQPETVKSLLDSIEWFWRYYRNQAETQVVMPAFEVQKAKRIEWAIDRITPRHRTVLHLVTGGWGPKGQMHWQGLDHFDGFGPIVLGTEACHYMANQAGEDVVTYARRIRDPETVRELIAVAKEHVQAALLAYQEQWRSYLVRKRA